MILERFYDEGLAQASYMIGCQAARSAVVVDPNRDVEAYLEAARRHGVRITHVTETHIHADFVSGARALARAAGAELLLSAEGGEGWRYTFAEARSAGELREGDAFAVGNVHLDVLHTPGHTPEHLTFLVTDTAGASEPIGALTGDFVFVGEVGRPDLLEKAAKEEGTMEEAARSLFRSLRRFRELPEWLQVWPGHGAGSACGKGMSAIPHSTIGYERRFNPAFAIQEEEAFVRHVLEGQPEPPTYFAEMKRINRDDPPVDARPAWPDRLSSDSLVDRIRDGAMVVDTRPARLFGRSHAAGTINIPLDRSFSTWAGWLVPYRNEFFLVVEEDGLERAVHDLGMIGLDRHLGGWWPCAALDTLADEQRREIAWVDVESVFRGWKDDEVAVVDVRSRSEWEEGHIPGVPNVYVGEIAQRMDEVPNGRPLMVHCESGARSAIAASVLQAAGRSDVINVAGGFGAWRREGYPVEAADR